MYSKVPFNNFDSDFKHTCCNRLMIGIGEVLSCERYGEYLGCVQEHPDETDRCILYKKTHDCPFEKKYAEKEKREREAAEKRAREEREVREAAEKKAREEKEAFERLRNAAEQGDAGAQYNLGLLYYNGMDFTARLREGRRMVWKSGGAGTRGSEGFPC